MDNEASKAFKMKMTTMNIKYKLVNPINHIENTVDRAIQNFKNHSISDISSVDKDFYLQCGTDYYSRQQSV